MEDYAYFRFYVAEWDNGIISDQSEHIEWAFLMIIKMYWQRGGVLSIEAVKKKYPSIRDEDISLLLSINCLKIAEGHLSISFMDRQLGECLLTSKKNSENALKRWAEEREKKLKKLNKNASALQPHNKPEKPSKSHRQSQNDAHEGKEEQNRTEQVTLPKVGSVTSSESRNGTPLPFGGKGGLTPEAAYEKLDKNAGLKGWNRESITTFFKKIIGHEFQDDIFATIKSDREAWPEAFAQAHQTLYRLKASAWQWDKSLFPELGIGDKPITYARLTNEQRMTVIEPKPETT